MIHAALLARRSRTRAGALVKLVGACLLLIEYVVLMVDYWHPWPEHGTKFSVTATGDLRWADGSMLGCATAYHPFDMEQDRASPSWHLDVYLGRAWLAEGKSFDLSTRQEVIDTATRWCKQ
jgi:hypothetical protein